MKRRAKSTWKQELILRQASTANRRSESLPRLLGDSELNGPLGLLLHDDCPRGNALAMRNVPHAQLHEITRSKLAVDGQVEQSELPSPRRELQANANCPDLFQPQRRLLNDELALVPRLPVMRGDASELVHDGSPFW
jgi:hypothetical protein